ncbi:hypothetical protein Trydic_g3859 [Trypoxylus dichotomus]
MENSTIISSQPISAMNNDILSKNLQYPTPNENFGNQSESQNKATDRHGPYESKLPLANIATPVGAGQEDTSFCGFCCDLCDCLIDCCECCLAILDLCNECSD